MVVVVVVVLVVVERAVAAAVVALLLMHTRHLRSNIRCNIYLVLILRCSVKQRKYELEHY